MADRNARPTPAPRRVRRAPAGQTSARRAAAGGIDSCSKGAPQAKAMSPAELHAAVERVRGEFLEMPGLRLTVAQAARLWGLDVTACEEVLDVLIRSSFLKKTPSGTVTRA
jgi:hypothetical protein